MMTDWELTVLDAAPPAIELASVTAGDIDGDGQVEVVTGGNKALLWYRPVTQERGLIADMQCPVGGALEDLDGDGILEIVVGDCDPSRHLFWFKMGRDLQDEWRRHIIDPDTAGHAHDIVFADLDGDGENELIVNAVYCSHPGVFAYKRTDDLKTPWRKITIQSGCVEEGLTTADLDGDGKLEIISGPHWYHAPTSGPWSGSWERHPFAPAHREMCRVASADITGNGRPDLILVDSEYLDGRLCWFENRLGQDGTENWVEHLIEENLVYAHSLDVRRGKDGRVRILCAEMGQGGWDAPRNWDARVIEYVSSDNGGTWQRTVIFQGEGTHEARLFDVDGDGELEIVGKDGYEKIAGKMQHPRVQLWKRQPSVSPLAQFRHRFLDRDKPATGIDLIVGDLDGDGTPELLCGEWWYRIADGERHGIPGIHQVIAAHDIDGDGCLEIVATKRRPGASDFWGQLSSLLVWLKPIDLKTGQWEEHAIGEGSGNWPHGVLIAPLLPDGKLALITGYHDAFDKGTRPELWEIPDDPTQSPWPKRTLMDRAYGEEFVACDIDGDGKLDIVAGATWLENKGDGTFLPHTIAEGFQAARVAVADFNADGRPDILLGEEVLDFENKVTPRSQLSWFENPRDPKMEPWTRHVIDTVRCAHSLAAADFDGDGEAEIVCGEHDPFWPYRTQCRLFVYKKADAQGLTWTRFTVDNRFEHHDGAKVVPLGHGRLGIASHGWKESIYVHLWEQP